MLHAGCVFVAGIHPSRTWMSGSFKSMQWSAHVHRLDFILSSERVLGESQLMLTPREKSPYRKNCPQRRIRLTTLHQAGQWAQHTTNELFQPPTGAGKRWGIQLVAGHKPALLWDLESSHWWRDEKNWRDTACKTAPEDHAWIPGRTTGC